MIFVRESLVLGVAVMVPVLWYVFRRERFGSHWSISLHAAVHRDTTLVFGAGLLAATVLLAVFYEGWLIPKYGYGWATQMALRASLVCFAGLALVPHYEGKWQGMVHTYLSWAMVVLMPLTLLLQTYETWGSWASLVSAGAIGMLGMLLAVFYGKKGMYEKFALLQGLYIAVYFTALAVMGYW